MSDLAEPIFSHEEQDHWGQAQRLLISALDRQKQKYEPREGASEVEIRNKRVIQQDMVELMGVVQSMHEDVAMLFVEPLIGNKKPNRQEDSDARLDQTLRLVGKQVLIFETPDRAVVQSEPLNDGRDSKLPSVLVGNAVVLGHEVRLAGGNVWQIVIDRKKS